MKLVIDLDETYYEIIKHDVKVNHSEFRPYKIIAKGIPLDKSQREQALELLLDWAIECDFGYDNLGTELNKKYKEEIKNFGYKEGLIYIAERELEKGKEE